MPSFPSVLFRSFLILITGFLPALANGGGTLHLARLFDPVTLDVTKMDLAEDFLLVPLLDQTLLDSRDGTNVIPGAAVSWSASPDKRVYTFKLRPGVRFSNGREVEARDYAFSIERILNPATAAPMGGYYQHIEGYENYARGLTNHVAGLSAPCADMLIISLDRPDPVFANLMINTVAVPAEEVARLGPRFSIQPVGTGPYMVRDWKRGVRLQLKRNPYYQGVEPQHLDGVDIMIGGDETTHLMMFERGELDIASITGFGIPVPSFRRLYQDPRWHDLFERVSLFTTYYLTLNTELPPFTNVLVRRAVNYAINRDKWMRVSLGYATHADGAIPRGMPGFNPALKGYEFNPDKARALLAETGLPLPLHTELWHSLDETYRFLAQGVQADLKRVGIDALLKPVTFAQLNSAAHIRHEVPMATTAWTVSIPDPVDMLGTQFDGRSVTNDETMNLAFYQSPQVDRLLDEAAPEINLNRRFQLYHQAEQLIVRDAPWAFLGFGNLWALRQRWLKGPMLDPVWIYRFDRVWIEN